MLNQVWTKSSYSTGGSANCVECRTTESRVLVRDTQHRDHGHLAVPTREWAALLGALRRDEV